MLQRLHKRERERETELLVLPGSALSLSFVFRSLASEKWARTLSAIPKAVRPAHLVAGDPRRRHCLRLMQVNVLVAPKLAPVFFLKGKLHPPKAEPNFNALHIFTQCSQAAEELPILQD